MLDDCHSGKVLAIDLAYEVLIDVRLPCPPLSLAFSLALSLRARGLLPPTMDGEWQSGAMMGGLLLSLAHSQMKNPYEELKWVSGNFEEKVKVGGQMTFSPLSFILTTS